MPADKSAWEAGRDLSGELLRFLNILDFIEIVLQHPPYSMPYLSTRPE
jgi:hypothetical protein